MTEDAGFAAKSPIRNLLVASDAVVSSQGRPKALDAIDTNMIFVYNIIQIEEAAKIRSSLMTFQVVISGKNHSSRNAWLQRVLSFKSGM